jgi:hypothetical protein
MSTMFIFYLEKMVLSILFEENNRERLILPKSQFGYVLEGHRMENVGIYWYNLRPFGIMSTRLVYLVCVP